MGHSFLNSNMKAKNRRKVNKFFENSTFGSFRAAAVPLHSFCWPHVGRRKKEDCHAR